MLKTTLIILLAGDMCSAAGHLLENVSFSLQQESVESIIAITDLEMRPFCPVMMMYLYLKQVAPSLPGFTTEIQTLRL